MFHLQASSAARQVAVGQRFIVAAANVAGARFGDEPAAEGESCCQELQRPSSHVVVVMTTAIAR